MIADAVSRVRLTVERLGHKGDGVAAGPVFVARALPGEVVEGAVQGGRMAAPAIVETSALRVKAPCPHYRACGGCALQHAPDRFVAEWKAEVLREALGAQGLAAPIRGVSTSPPGSRRRAALSARRLKGGAVVGFHAHASEALTRVPSCLVLRPEILAALPAIEALAAAGGSRSGELSVHTLVTGTGLDIAVEGGKPADAVLGATLADIAREGRFARLTWGGESLAMAAPPIVRFGRADVTPPPGAFLQATTEGEAALAAAVREALGGARRVVDLFSGCGTFALPLAEAAEVHSVEGEAPLIEALLAGWRRAVGLRRVTAEARDLFRRPLLPEELERFDAAVVDPPRAGAEAQCRALAISGVPRIALVSCNPATFARDARILEEGGYRIAWIEVVDQFRWSPHIEVVASLARA